jgi:hypothetical protein
MTLLSHHTQLSSGTMLLFNLVNSSCLAWTHYPVALWTARCHSMTNFLNTSIHVSSQDQRDIPGAQPLKDHPLGEVQPRAPWCPQVEAE